MHNVNLMMENSRQTQIKDQIKTQINIRQVMTNLDSILKSRDITLPTKVRLVKAVVFPVVMYGCESWSIKKAECWRIDAFELWCWRRLLRVPWTARRSNCCRKGDPFQGPKLGSCLTLRNELSEETHVLTKQEILLERAPRWRAGGWGNPGELLCHVAHSLGFYGDGISFWVVFGQSF